MELGKPRETYTGVELSSAHALHGHAVHITVFVRNAFPRSKSLVDEMPRGEVVLKLKGETLTLPLQPVPGRLAVAVARYSTPPLLHAGSYGLIAIFDPAPNSTFSTSMNRNYKFRVHKGACYEAVWLSVRSDEIGGEGERERER